MGTILGPGYSLSTRTVRVLFWECVLVTVMVMFAGISMAAADPATSPYEIVAEGFESPAPFPGFTIGPTALTAPVSTAWWGRMSPPTGRAAVGSYGLWCAGSVPAYWATYPKNSHGLASLDVSAAEEYYSTDLSFAYTMPTLGYHDTRSFRVAWYGNDDPTSMETLIELAKTGVNSWVTLEYDLARAGGYLNLSRTALTVEFQWVDRVEYPIGTTSSGTPIYPTVKQGEGPTIDSITIRGYKYGPVRNLTSAATAGGIELTWDAPYEATNNAVADDRSYVYRVWVAEDDGAPYSWTELTTPVGIAAATITHASAMPGVMYRYLVQAWDVDSVSPRVWGEPIETTGRLLSAELDCTIDTGGVVLLKNGDNVTLTYIVTNTGEVGLTNVQLRDGGSELLASWATLAADEVQPYVTDESPTADMTYEAVVTASEGASSGDSVFIDVRNPAVQLAINPVNIEVVEGASVDVEYTITNSGDTDLHSVEVVDSSAQVLFSGLSLGVGEDVTLVRAVQVAENVTLSAKAVGVYGAAATTFYGDVGSAIDTASITVVESRIAGANRYTTGIELSKAAFGSPLTGEKAVVIASGAGWADALPASALAGVVNGPLLLSAPTSVPSEVLAEISRLEADKAYIVGGTAVLTDAVRDQLQSAGLTVQRVWGANRYATAQAVALEVNRKTSVDTVFIATGANFPDALAASSLAAALKAPILLTRADGLPAETQLALETLSPDNVIVCGGQAVISSSVESALGSSSFGSPSVTREAGANRYETALEIVERGIMLTGVSEPAGVFVATGTNYPDALAGGVLAGIGGAQWRPLMLVDPNDPQTRSPQLATLIDANPSIGFATLLGGPSALDEAVETYVLGLVR